jgi:hypothetical protein
MWQGWLIDVVLRVPQRKKLHGVRSGDLGGQVQVSSSNCCNPAVWKGFTEVTADFAMKMRQSTIEEDFLEKEWHEFDYRLDVFRVIRGAQNERL